MFDGASVIMRRFNRSTRKILQGSIKHFVKLSREIESYVQDAVDGRVPDQDCSKLLWIIGTCIECSDHFVCEEHYKHETECLPR